MPILYVHTTCAPRIFLWNVIYAYYKYVVIIELHIIFNYTQNKMSSITFGCKSNKGRMYIYIYIYI